MRNVVIAFFLSLLIAGCSTTPVQPSQAKQVEPILKFQKSDNTLPVVIVRDKGYTAGACSITVFVDGQQVANLDTAEKTTIYVNPGPIVLGAGFIGSGLCSGAPRNEREFSIHDDSKVIRISIDQSGNVDLRPMTL